MMEENNDIFLTGGDVPVYLTEPMHKKYSLIFGWGHPFSISFLIPLLLYAPVHILDHPLPFPQLRTYLMYGVSLNQKTNKNIRKSYSLKYKHSKKNSL